jgi:hypothetical protein
MKLIRFGWLLFFVLCMASAKAQTDSVYFTKEMFQNKIDELRTKQGYEKVIPREFELPVLVALTYYPELDSIPIDFVCLPIKTTMMAQPRSKTFFAGKGHRDYAIFINTSKKNTGFAASELTFNQLVGVFGHELGHISYYRTRNSCQLLVDAFGYYFKNYKTSFENGTDIITIEHGLGWQLLDFSNFVTHKAKLSKSYAHKKKLSYLTDEEIYSILLKKKR